VLAEILLVISLVVIFVGAIALLVINHKERPRASSGSIGRYDFDFNEHQNYWEAENR
jgi:hypothetical protein